MLKIFTIFIFFISLQAKSIEFKVMSFNTMCDFCGKKGFDDFDKRKKVIKEIIEKFPADLYSLQEIRTASQLKYFFQDKKNFKLIFWDSLLLSYPDPSLAINTERFSILETGFFWLGPNQGSFSIGWKYALPRMVQWVKLEDKITKQKFYFMGTHFDNRVENMLGSAQMVNEFIQRKKLPIIFAGDTNCTMDFEGYQKLIHDNLVNSFDLSQKKISLEKQLPGTSLCYLRKGKIFPLCRVDHILLTKNSPWKISNWDIIPYKNQDLKNFPSDHRPIMSTFTY